MAKWQIALALLAGAALLHIVGVVRQIRHYRRVFGELGSRWRDGRIGVGAAGAGAGVTAIVVSDAAGIVQAVRVRRGRGVFGKFLPRDEFMGLDAAGLRIRIAAPGMDPVVGQAVAGAIAEIEQKARESG